MLHKDKKFKPFSWLRKNCLNIIVFLLMSILLLAVAFFIIDKSKISTRAASCGSEIGENEIVLKPGESEIIETHLLRRDTLPSSYMDIPLSSELQDYVIDLAYLFDIPSELIYAVMYVESGFNNNVISSKNCCGLMQINIRYANSLKEKLNVTDPFDPYQNILCGVYILSEHVDAANGNFSHALMMYNCGAGAAKKLISKGIDSTNYSKKVLRIYERYVAEKM